MLGFQFYSFFVVSTTVPWITNARVRLKSRVPIQQQGTKNGTASEGLKCYSCQHVVDQEPQVTIGLSMTWPPVGGYATTMVPWLVHVQKQLSCSPTACSGLSGRYSLPRSANRRHKGAMALTAESPRLYFCITSLPREKDSCKEREVELTGRLPTCGLRNNSSQFPHSSFLLQVVDLLDLCQLAVSQRFQQALLTLCTPDAL